MENITVEDIKKAVGTVAGRHSFLVKQCSLHPRKNTDAMYMAGTLGDKTGEIGFKIWETAIINTLSVDNLPGKVVTVEIKISEYKGTKEAVITDITINEDIDKALFQKSYDIAALAKRFEKVISETLSERAVEVVNLVLTGAVKKLFLVEQAASGNHDALRGGLLGHTTKGMELVQGLLNQHEFDEATRDLIMLGYTFHDIGKIYEMNEGVYTEQSVVTHRILGIEILFAVKEKIIELYDEMFYYNLLSILQGHHGDFEDPCRTVYAKIVHCVDMLEAWTTMVDEGFKDKTDLVDSKVSRRILKY